MKCAILKMKCAILCAILLCNTEQIYVQYCVQYFHRYCKNCTNCEYWEIVLISEDIAHFPTQYWNDLVCRCHSHLTRRSLTLRLTEPCAGSLPGQPDWAPGISEPDSMSSESIMMIIIIMISESAGVTEPGLPVAT